MDQFDQFDQFDEEPFISPSPPLPPPLPPPPPIDALHALLALPPIAIYPSKEALFEAIQDWSKTRGYAFVISRSTRLKSGRQKVNYACDRHPPVRPLVQGIRDTQSRGSGCLFSIIAAETPSLNWEVRYRLEARFNTHNHPPSLSPAAHPSHRKLPTILQNTARNLLLAGNNYIYNKSYN
jgi:hypothetical protein